MEFLDINVRTDLTLFLHAIHSLFYWRILQKTILYANLKSMQKIRGRRNLEPIHEKHVVERKNEGRKPDKNSRRFEFMLKNLD